VCSQNTIGFIFGLEPNLAKSSYMITTFINNSQFGYQKNSKKQLCWEVVIFLSWQMFGS
jgi:hypothetical protein